MKIRRTLHALSLTAALIAFTPSGAVAQDEAEYSAETLNDDGFRAVEGDPTDEVPGGPLLVAAYLALWLLVGGYLVRLSRRHAEVQQEYAALRRALEDIDDRLAELSRSE